MARASNATQPGRPYVARAMSTSAAASSGDRRIHPRRSGDAPGPERFSATADHAREGRLRGGEDDEPRSGRAPGERIEGGEPRSTSAGIGDHEVARQVPEVVLQVGGECGADRASRSATADEDEPLAGRAAGRAARRECRRPRARRRRGQRDPGEQQGQAHRGDDIGEPRDAEVERDDAEPHGDCQAVRASTTRPTPGIDLGAGRAAADACRRWPRPAARGPRQRRRRSPAASQHRGGSYAQLARGGGRRRGSRQEGRRSAARPVAAAAAAPARGSLPRAQTVPPAIDASSRRQQAAERGDARRATTRRARPAPHRRPQTRRPGAGRRSGRGGPRAADPGPGLAPYPTAGRRARSARHDEPAGPEPDSRPDRAAALRPGEAPGRGRGPGGPGADRMSSTRLTVDPRLRRPDAALVRGPVRGCGGRGAACRGISTIARPAQARR